MKKGILFTAFLLSALLLVNGNQGKAACTCKTQTSLTSAETTQAKVKPVDYSMKSNWMHITTNPKHEVDLLYFYPTSTQKPIDGYKFGAINNENKKSAQAAFNRSGSAFSSYTNVFAPYYRQLPATEIVGITVDEAREKLEKGQGKKDVFNALDYYFNNLNNGRPFIISSHSQGSFIMQLAFEEYFSKHPEYLDRMVAAYIVGIPITNKWLKENHLKFAKGETDTGVIIAWNTEGANATGGAGLKQKVINPINWKTDTTPATVEENKGSVNYNTFKSEKGMADATINKKRGTVVCTTSENYATPLAIIFGDKNLHFFDYTFYYENIKENGLKRVEAYLGHKVK